MLALKRAADVALGTLGVALFLPLGILLAMAIRLSSGSPVIFKTRRIGHRGRVFTMYKFRTMSVGSQEEQETLGPLNLAQGMVKIPDDPRVTLLGKSLRRLSLDELPQLLNVVRGDMSLIGPRPHDLGEVSPDDELTRRRLTMRPGLTGLWQVRARTNPSLDVRVNYDLEYISRWSLLLDLSIALETIPVVLRGEGGRVVFSQQHPRHRGGTTPPSRTSLAERAPRRP